jgi:uncharacterized protein (UPF0335 family)
MARKRNDGTQGERGTLKLVTAADEAAALRKRRIDFLLQIAARLDKPRRQAEDARSSQGVIFKELKDRGENTGMFKLALKIRDWSDEEISENFDALTFYLETLGVEERQGNLFRPPAESTFRQAAGNKPGASDSDEPTGPM